MFASLAFCLFFFFNDTATTEIYTLSLHDALPISRERGAHGVRPGGAGSPSPPGGHAFRRVDRKSTRLNSSHLVISYAVFCLKKKKKKYYTDSAYTPQDAHTVVSACAVSLHCRHAI